MRISEPNCRPRRITSSKEAMAGRDRERGEYKGEADQEDRRFFMADPHERFLPSFGTKCWLAGPQQMT